MADILISEQLLVILVGTVLFETALIFSYYIVLRMGLDKPQEELSFFQKLDSEKFIIGLFLCYLAITYLLGMLEFISTNPSPIIGIGLYWMGLTFVLNGLFTQKQAFHSINQRLNGLSQQINTRRD